MTAQPLDKWILRLYLVIDINKAHVPGIFDCTGEGGYLKATWVQFERTQEQYLFERQQFTIAFVIAFRSSGYCKRIK